MAKKHEDSLKGKSYEIIKNKILTCELMPGAVIQQEALMEEIGVSRTPVREALNALAQEELVLILPRRGFFVTNISAKDINHIFAVREAIEPVIARMATPYVEEGALREFRLVFENETENITELTNNDYMMHKYFAEKTGNKYLIHLMENVLSHSRRISVLGARIPRRMLISNKEHIEVIDMMLRRNAEGAEEAMRAHIRQAGMAAAALKDFL